MHGGCAPARANSGNILVYVIAFAWTLRCARDVEGLLVIYAEMRGVFKRVIMDREEMRGEETIVHVKSWMNNERVLRAHLMSKKKGTYYTPIYW